MKTKTKQTKSKKPAPSYTLILKTESVDEPYIRYFTDLKVDIGLLVLFPKKKPLLFYSPLEKPPVSSEYTTKPFTIAEVEKFFQQTKPKRVGYDAQHLSVRSLNIIKKLCKGAKFVDVSEDLVKQTKIKSKEQIKLLRKAVKITENILAKLFKALPSMKTENEAITFLRIETLKAGGELSFDPIVASGKHAKNPHYKPKPNSALQKGFCIIDFGVKYGGYCADISRTIYFGTPLAKEKAAYIQVEKYLISLEKRLKAGTSTVKNPWDIPHALGHGIGMQVHESPLVGKDKLVTNMCIAVEPGKYTKTFGIRIEDNYVVQKTGLKRLSTSSRRLKVIKY